jgi:uncharacterized protein YjiS (DUF1127 family)
MRAISVSEAPRRPLRLPLPPIRRWLELARQRRQLAALSDSMLRDLGLTRADAEHEAARPFWEVPRR